MFKRMMAAIVALVMVFNLTACAQKSKRFEAEFLVLFDTVTRIVAYMPDKEGFMGFAQFVYDNLETYHQLYDIYNDYDGINNIKTINDNAGIAPVKVDARIIDLLLLARQMYQKTEGKVNVAYGAVLSIWHRYRTAGIEDPLNAKLPPINQLQAAAAHTNIDNMVIDQSNQTVYLTDPNMSLDVGAIAKGYAVEQVCLLAQREGYTTGLISVGGNVRAIGTKDGDEQDWNVGILSPDTDTEARDNMAIVYLSDRAVVTSGDYERYYTVDGVNYHHIIDPDTLYPAQYYTMITIIGPNSGEADALSTALFCMPLEQARAYVENRDDMEALWVLKSGELVYSSGFTAYTQQ